MAEGSLTQCPRCHAVFRVTDKQLAAAQGRVRCGACMTIFKAPEHFIEEETAPAPAQRQSSPQQAAPQPTTPKPASPEQPVADTTPPAQKEPPAEAFSQELFDFSLDDEPEATPTRKKAEPAAATDRDVTDSKTTDDHAANNNDANSNDEDDFIFADDPDEDATETSYGRLELDESELSDSFLEIDRNKGHSGPRFDDLEDEEAAGQDESWAQEMLEELEKAPTSLKMDTAPAPQTDKRDDEPDYSAPEPAAPAALISNSIPSATSTAHAQAVFGQLKSEPVAIPSQAIGINWLGAIGWSLINLALLLALLLQLAWFHADRLLQFPQVMPLYEVTCQYLGCRPPELINTRQIRSRNLVVRTHPQIPKALVIDAIIVNQASFEQPFPNLGLYFSDLSTAVVAQRLFTPQEYLSGDLAKLDAMPVNTPIHITLEIIDPGKEAVNYRLTFHRS